MGKFDFEIQPAPEPPDPEAARAPIERTRLQESVTWLTLLPVVGVAVLALCLAGTRVIRASSNITRLEDLARGASASLAPVAADLEQWGQNAQTLEQVWRGGHSARLDALRQHRTACHLLLLLGGAALVPALIIWSRGQFGRPGGPWRLDAAQLGLSTITVALFGAGWAYNSRTLEAANRLGPGHDIGRLAMSMIDGAKAERLAPWRAALDEALAALQPPPVTGKDYSCAADTVLNCVNASEFDLLDHQEKASLGRTLEALARAHFSDAAAFEPLTRARRPFVGDRDVNELLAEQERETRQFSGDAEAAEYLFEAIRQDNDAAVRMMVRRGIDVNCLMPGEAGGYTPLFAAVKHRRTGIVRFLLERGARPDIGSGPRPGSDRCGDFPAHAAVGDARLMRLLLERGADPNVRNVRGQTPLHLAALAGDRSSIRLLATRRVDLNAADACGQTPLDLTNDPHATDAARGANALLQQLGALTAADVQ